MWKSRALFLFALICSVALLRFYNNRDVAALALYALILLALLSLAAVLTAPFSLRIEESADGREIFKDDPLRYKATLVNRSLFFYQRISCVYHSAELVDYGAETVSVTPRGRLRSSADLRFRYRGVYRLGVKSVTVTDFLGLFCVTFPVTSPLTVTVFPAGDETFAVYMRGDSSNVAFRQDLRNESYADVADVRKYTDSDSFRKIHWKLSAKRGELMVKNFHSFEPNRTLLYVDAKEIPLQEAASAAFEDKMVSFAAAAVDHCLQSRLSAALASSGELEALAVIDPSEGPDKIYRILAGIAFMQEESELPRFCRALERGGMSYNLLLFLSDLDRAVHDALVQFATHDDNLYVYYFYSKDLPPTSTIEGHLDSLKTQGIAVNRVEVEPLP